MRIRTCVVAALLALAPASVAHASPGGPTCTATLVAAAPGDEATCHTGPKSVFVVTIEVVTGGVSWTIEPIGGVTVTGSGPATVNGQCATLCGQVHLTLTATAYNTTANGTIS